MGYKEILKNQIEKSEVDHKVHEERVAELREQLITFGNTKQTLKKKLKKLENDLDDFERTQVQIQAKLNNDLHRELEIKDEEIKMLNIKISTLQKEYENIKRTHMQQVHNVKMLLKKEREEHVNKINEQKTKIEKLNDLLREEQKKVSEVKQTQIQLEEYKQKMHELNTLQLMLKDDQKITCEVDQLKLMLQKEQEKSCEIEKLKIFFEKKKKKS